MKFVRFLYDLFFTIMGLLALTNCAPLDPLSMQSIDIPVEKDTPTDGAIFSLGNDAFLYSSARSHRLGDLLTIHLYENNDAKDLYLSRTNKGSSLNLDAFGSYLDKNHKGALGFSGKSNVNGEDNNHQNNKMTGDITVMVTEILPNKNLVVKGYKTITLNNGVEKIGVSGIVKEEDIKATDNSVLSSQIASAHIAYISSGDSGRSASQNWLQNFFSYVFLHVLGFLISGGSRALFFSFNSYDTFYLLC